MNKLLREALITQVREFHVQAMQIVQSGEQHIPILFLLTEGGKIEPIPFTEYIDDKDLAADMLQAFRAKEGVVATIFLSEAWTITIPKDSAAGRRLAAGKNPLRKPSESHDRKECLFYMVQTADNDQFAVQAEIIRGESEITFGPLEIMTEDSEDTKMVGRFVGDPLNP